MLRKSAFFDFLNRRDESDFAGFLASSHEDIDFINWNEYALPFNWGDAAYEYAELRNRCAIFDSTPFQKIRIRGGRVGELLDRTFTRPVSTLTAMRATYVILCNDDGTIKDDAILFKYADDDFLLMPSDIDHTPYLESLCERFEISGVSFTNQSDLYSGMAVQGPASASALAAMGFEGIDTLKPFQIRDFVLHGETVRVGRVGFTADLGYECWMPVSHVAAFQQAVVEARQITGLAMPGYGLRTLETCRLEGGFVVAAWDFATELDPQPGFERTPYEVGLDWIVHLDAADFVGRAALIKQQQDGPRFAFKQLTVSQQLEVDDGEIIYALVDGERQEIGFVACSSWSWGLDQVIGNASVETHYADVTDAFLDIAGNEVALRLTNEPLMTFAHRNTTPAYQPN